jgi:hypothetical protein
MMKMCFMIILTKNAVKNAPNHQNKTPNNLLGAGIVTPGTGIFLNNEMDAFAAASGVANAFCHHTAQFGVYY